MKRIAIGLTAALILLTAGGAVNAGWMEQPFFNFGKGITVPSKYFEIEAQGWDLRGYVFQVPDKSRTCLFVAGSNKGGLNCWKTSENAN